MFSKKEIVLDCYTYRSEVYNYFPIAKGSKHFPEFFKNTKKIPPKSSYGTLLHCPAFIDYFKLGFVLPLWSDLFLEVGQKGSGSYKWQYADERSQMDFHGENQTGIPEKEYQQFKLVTPWVLSCKEDVQFLFSAPSWHFESFPNTLSIVNAVVDFKRNAATNINMVVQRLEQPHSFVLRANTPLIHLIPMTDKKIVLKTHLVPIEVYDSVEGPNRKVTFSSVCKKKIRNAHQGKFKTLA